MGVSPEQCRQGSKISRQTTSAGRNHQLGNAVKLTMVCIDTNCPSRVHAHVPKWDVIWVVSDVVNHTCELKKIPEDHRNLTSPLLARLLYSELVETQATRLKSIQIK